MNKTLSIAAIVGVICACSEALTPRFPADAVPMSALLQYELWWEVTKSCSGLGGDLSDVHFYMLPGTTEFPIGHEMAAGLWWPDGNRILIAEASLDDGWLVRHEMLHAIGRWSGHPAAYFRDRCGGIVTCSGPHCLSEAGPLPDPPASAQVVDPADMDVSVKLTPVVYSAATGGWIVITVEVFNARSTPVWVALARPAGYVSADLYGYRLGSAMAATVPTHDQKIGFAAGETKRFTFDVQLGVSPSLFGPGTYPVRGVFNGDTTSTVTLTIPP